MRQDGGREGNRGEGYSVKIYGMVERETSIHNSSKLFFENINRGCRDYLDRISAQRQRVDESAMNLQWVHEPLHSPCNVGGVALLTNVARYTHLSFSTFLQAITTLARELIRHSAQDTQYCKLQRFSQMANSQKDQPKNKSLSEN